MTITEQVITVGSVVLATMATRFLPWFIFTSSKPTPRVVQFLGRVLPAAVFGLLVVYCLKHVSLFSGTHGIPEALGILVTIGLHIWRRDMLLSIGGGTIFYMFLVQQVFGYPAKIRFTPKGNMVQWM